MIHSFDPSTTQGYLITSNMDIVSDIVLVWGCFDVLHYGHLKFLEAAKACKSASTSASSQNPDRTRLVVALESDAAIVKTKDRRVFHTQAQRAELLDALDIVTDVLMLPLMTTDQAYMDLVKFVNPSVIALTEGDPRLAHKTHQADTVGAKIIEIPFERGFSTTDLLHKYCTF